MIDVMKDEEFDGKVIGVADYANSLSSHTLFVEIKNPSGGDSYFLTYNRKKGMNADTLDSADKIVLVQGKPGGQSWRRAKIGPGETHKIENFLNGRDLEITVGTAGIDGSVDYVPVTIKQQSISCTSDSDCVTSQTCFSGTCLLGLCTYTADSDCCGNGICETSESCGTCSSECKAPVDCNEIDGKNDNSIGGYLSDQDYGIVFDVQVTKDLYFYEIEADITTTYGVPAKVYTRPGSYTTSSDLNGFVKVFDGTSSTPSFYKTLMKFSERAYTPSGSTRAFYISYTSGRAFYYGDGNTVTNADGIILPGGTTVNQSGSNTLPNIRRANSAFMGGLKYDYVASPSPTPTVLTSAPTPVPTPTPTLGPTPVPTFAPVIGPTPVPTRSPTPLPTPAPVPKPPTALKICKDSGVKFLMRNKKERHCRWVGNNPEKKERRCNFKNVASHCPKTCGKCDEFLCEDSAKPWKLWFGRRRTCEWVGRIESKIPRRCKKRGGK